MPSDRLEPSHFCIDLAQNKLEVQAKSQTTQLVVVLALNKTVTGPNGEEVEINHPVVSDTFKKALAQFSRIVSNEIKGYVV